MTSAAVRDHLTTVARDVIQHTEQASIPLAKSVVQMTPDRYTDQGIHDEDRVKLFGRVPLMLAASCELTEPGQFKTIDVAGVPVLLVRDKSGDARAYLNACTHRGAQLAQGCGHANRFTCPYHGWTFSASGELVGVPLQEDFGEIDLAGQSLVTFPVYESAGLIWVTLNENPELDAATFLKGYDDFLSVFDLESWHVVQQRSLPGSNWKLAFDAHLDFYHLPVLHKETFGPNSSPIALYYHWGPHQRLIQPLGNNGTVRAHRDLATHMDRPEAEWPLASMMLGEWIIFPNVSLNVFNVGGIGMIISQVVPGAEVGTSVTIQTYIMAEKPNAAELADAIAHCDLLERAVAGEDLPNSALQENVLNTGFLATVTLGKTESGVQEFHNWLDRVRTTEDGALGELFDYKSEFADAAGDAL